MRITNTMMTSRMLLSINRNTRNVDALYNQLSTGKQIQYPSDNPILAARALKFRTSVADTQQYQRNVSQGLSWMEVSERGFTNAGDILKTIRDLSVRASSDVPNTTDDRKKIMDQISQLIDQLGTEMNITYAGRYVFSGYRTDQPPTFTEDQPGANCEIAQTFDATDMEKTLSYRKVNATAVPETHDVNIVKLAYKNAGAPTVGVTLPPPVPPAAAPVITVNTTGLNNAPPYTATNLDPYAPAPGTINYIPETGELVLADDIAASFTGLTVTYQKQGFNRGELNPLVYFNTTDLNTGDTYTMDRLTQSIEYEFGVNTRIGVNSLAKDSYTDKLYADLKGLQELIGRVAFSSESDLRNYYASTLGGGLTGQALEDAVSQQMQVETQQTRGVLQSRFKDMIDMIDRHTGRISAEHTDLGSRMNRLELIDDRLADDQISYQKLLSDNEDVDYMEAIMNMNIAQSIYQASLKTGASMIQMSLADFIR